MNTAVAYEIRELASETGGVRLALLVEGAVVATASASGEILHDMQAMLGLTRDAVVTNLRDALLDVLRTQDQLVQIDSIVEEQGRALRFIGRYTHRLRNELQAGIVWYDVNTSMTGPEDVPAVVRNKMRFEVHRRLTGDSGAARALVDLHK